MATFQAQVQGLTSLTISSSGTNPTEAQLTQFLHDGTHDVTRRWLSVEPKDTPYFSAKSDPLTSNGFANPGAQILSVIREAEADGSTDGSTAWRECRKIDVSMQSRVIDTESIHYASKFNPVYMIDAGGAIYVYPVPDGTDDSYHIYSTNSAPANNSGSSLAYSHSTIANFPDDKEYLVSMYAAIKSLECALGSAGSIPTVQGGSDELTDVTQLTAENTIDDFDGNAIDFDQWYATLSHFIEDEEDQELAQMQIQKINSYIQAFQTQNQANISNHAFLQLRHALLSKQYEQAFIQGKELKK
tara:strand:- start:722 stop:1624 length:903 start_codon:yes stop_codon:yes gene_type:complete